MQVYGGPEQALQRNILLSTPPGAEGNEDTRIGYDELQGDVYFGLVKCDALLNLAGTVIFRLG